MEAHTYIPISYYKIVYIHDYKKIIKWKRLREKMKKKKNERAMVNI